MSFKVVSNDGENVVLETVCPFCMNAHQMTFSYNELSAGLTRYRSGALLQNAFPTFSPSQREFLYTGICDRCWDSM